MDLIFVILLICLHLGCGWYATKLIKKRDFDAPPAVDVIIVLHGVLSLISTLAVQNLLFPGEDGKPKTVFLRDGMTLDLDKEEHRELYDQLKKINKK